MVSFAQTFRAPGNIGKLVILSGVAPVTFLTLMIVFTGLLLGMRVVLSGIPGTTPTAIKLVGMAITWLLCFSVMSASF